MKQNIALIFGGESTEHDISILTGIQVANGLNKQKYNLIPIYIHSSGEWFSGQELLNVEFFKNFNQKKVKHVSILPISNHLFVEKFGKFKRGKKLDCAIIACHGKNGEDGTVQGLLQLAKIPYTSAGVFASSVGLDKQKMKELFSANKIPICSYISVSKQDFEELGTEKLGRLEYPVVVKPNSLGSSIGISICQNEDMLIDALKLAFNFDNLALVERCITNLQEVNISVLGDGKNCLCSVTEQPLANGLLSFEKKYLSGTTKIASVGTKNGMQNADRIIPAKLSKREENYIQKLAKKIFEITNSKGVVRIDFLVDREKNKIYANEINTIPGSFAFYLWQKSGIEFDELLDRTIQIAINHQTEQNKLIKTLNLLF